MISYITRHCLCRIHAQLNTQGNFEMTGVHLPNQRTSQRMLSATLLTNLIMTSHSSIVPHSAFNCHNGTVWLEAQSTTANQSVIFRHTGTDGNRIPSHSEFISNIDEIRLYVGVSIVVSSNKTSVDKIVNGVWSCRCSEAQPTSIHIHEWMRTTSTTINSSTSTHISSHTTYRSSAQRQLARYGTWMKSYASARFMSQFDDEYVMTYALFVPKKISVATVNNASDCRNMCSSVVVYRDVNSSVTLESAPTHFTSINVWNVSTMDGCRFIGDHGWLNYSELREEPSSSCRS